MPKHLNQNSKTEGSGRVQRQFKFKTTSTSSSRQLQPSCKNIQQTCYVMILSCRGISYGIAIFLMTPWQLHHWIIQVPQYRTKTNNKRQRSCKNHPMSPQVSNQSQLTSKQITAVKPDDIQLQHSNMNIHANCKTGHLQNPILLLTAPAYQTAPALYKDCCQKTK